MRYVVLGIAALLGGCAAVAGPRGELIIPPPGRPVVDYCTTAQPVRVSRADTRGTKEQADREYRKYVAVCGEPPK